MTLAKRILIIAIISLTCISCDQITKVIAQEYFQNTKMSSYLFDTLRIGYTENHGAFLGLGNSLAEHYRYWIFVVAVGLFLFGLLIHMVAKSSNDTSYIVGVSMIFSGGVSNLYDRVTNDGGVVDFLNVGFGSIRTGVFNVADMAIMAGALVILISTFRQRAIFGNDG